MFIGQVFCYYMTQSACGYIKQCAEILFSSDKTSSSSSVSSRAFALDSDTLQQSGEPLSHMGKWQETKPVAKHGMDGSTCARPPSPWALLTDLPVIALTNDNPRAAP